MSLLYNPIFPFAYLTNSHCSRRVMKRNRQSTRTLVCWWVSNFCRVISVESLTAGKFSQCCEFANLEDLPPCDCLRVFLLALRVSLIALRVSLDVITVNPQIRPLEAFSNLTLELIRGECLMEVWGLTKIF